MTGRDHRLVKQYGEYVYETLHDLLEFGEMAADVVSHGKAAYDRELTLRLAAEAVAHKIGEAVARLTDKAARTEQELTFTADHPEIPWRAMKGMRNIVAHDCGGIDHQILWNALAEVLPQDLDRLRRIMGE